MTGAASSDFTENDRSSRLDQRSGEEELRSQTGKRLFNQIKLAHGNAAGKQQQVRRVQADMYKRGELALFIRSNRELHRLTSSLQNLCGKGVAVRVADLMRSWNIRDIDEFITGGKDCNPRSAIHRQFGTPNSGGQRDLGRTDVRARSKKHVASMRFSPGRNQVFAWLGAALNFHLTDGKQCVLDHYNGIGPGRDRGAGHDLNCFSWAYGSLESSSSLDLSKHAQFCRQRLKIGSAHCVPITSGTGEGRKIAVSRDGLRKHTPQGARKRHVLSIAHAEIAAVAAHGFVGLLKREHTGRGLRRSHHCRL